MVYKLEQKGAEKVGWQAEKQDEPQSSIFELGAYTKGMIDNDTYNLIEFLELENKGLWLIKNAYKTDAAENIESTQLWDALEKQKMKIVKLLNERISRRL